LGSLRLVVICVVIMVGWLFIWLGWLFLVVGFKATIVWACLCLWWRVWCLWFVVFCWFVLVVLLCCRWLLSMLGFLLCVGVGLIIVSVACFMRVLRVACLRLGSWWCLWGCVYCWLRIGMLCCIWCRVLLGLVLWVAVSVSWYYWVSCWCWEW